jgi:Fur family ferric uptake transcriptional regulator
VGSIEVAEVLREHGHRVTRPRVAVWRALETSSGHATVEDLAVRAQELEPGVNLASVYRSLALFADLDLARESRLGDDEATRWEIAHPDEHFHLVCEACGRVDHHVGELVGQIEQHLRDGHAFVPRTVELIVTGRCAACMDRR